MTRVLAPQIATKIVEHVRANRLATGAHLGTQYLANLFNVSRVPVTAALNLLAQEGVVNAVHNRGFFLARDAADLPDQNGGIHVNSEDPLYYQLAEDWLCGKIEERISENELMRFYKVPRNRLLKVLQRAAEDLWVERLPGHGWHFQSVMVSLQAYEEGYRFRMVIEPAALLECSFHIDKAILDSLAKQQIALLKGGIRKFSRTELFAINCQFHEAIIGFSNNPFFLDAIRKVDRVRRLLDYRSTVNRDRLIKQCSEHLEIIDLLEQGDIQGAASFLRSHIKGALDSKLSLVANSPQLANETLAPAHFAR